jgi:flagellar biosynthesis/type III secretory pathway protein FliH
MCKIMEDFLRECREESYAEGYAEGYEESYAEGRIEGLRKNIATLTQKGMSLEDALNLLDVSEADRALLRA